MGGRVSHTRLVKVLFLLRHETSIRDDRTFYDFVPYRFGPFSFAFYRELKALERDGYLDEGRHAVILRRTAATKTERCRLGPDTAAAIKEVTDAYGSIRRKALLQDVYARYGWYASKSELQHLCPAGPPRLPRAPLAVYTVGYEGKSVDRFFDGLLRAGVHAVLDVRANPVSMKYGFAKSSLRDIAVKLGLEYHHLPELGIASSDRADLDGYDSYQQLMKRYEDVMLPQRKLAIVKLIGLLRQRPSALLCMERDVSCCHRGRLASAAARQSGLSVIHL
jgi:hypothetical protein